jgi:hypothetical protein
LVDSVQAAIESCRGAYCSYVNASSAESPKISGGRIAQVVPIPGSERACEASVECRCPPTATIDCEISQVSHVRLRRRAKPEAMMTSICLLSVSAVNRRSSVFKNADYVLCPDCRVVGRMDDPLLSRNGAGDLGFKVQLGPLAEEENILKKLVVSQVR